MRQVWDWLAALRAAARFDIDERCLARGDEPSQSVGTFGGLSRPPGFGILLPYLLSCFIRSLVWLVLLTRS